MNQPLPPIEQAKVFFFFALLTLLLFVGGAGIPLVLVTVWGLYRMRSTHDFSYLGTVFIIHKGFAAIASIGLGTFSAYLVFYYWDKDWYTEYVMYLMLSLLIYPVYSFLLTTLFYDPLSNHKEWVVANGIFATTVAANNKSPARPLFSFKSSPNLSVADELIKWNKLKDSGLITEEEFAKGRRDLLN